MTLSIKDPEADRLARAVAARTGETLTQAVIGALKERLMREEAKSDDMEPEVEEALSLARHFQSLPVRDPRPLDALLYDENGLPQ